MELEEERRGAVKGDGPGVKNYHAQLIQASKLAETRAEPLSYSLGLSERLCKSEHVHRSLHKVPPAAAAFGAEGS